MTLSVSECLSFFPYQLDKLHEVDDGKSVRCFLTEITYVTQPAAAFPSSSQTHRLTKGSVALHISTYEQH